MSTALYNDAAASAYGNTPIPAENSTDLGIIEGNRLNLLPEHALIIYIRCCEQLSQCQLSSRCARVFYAVLNQTVGRKKYEDNANSMNLQKYTKIRHDHAAQAMKELVAMNILMHRVGGKYRNWLSVNFNFSTWGNPNCSLSQKSNDPSVLLPKTYTETPIDTGLALDISVFEQMAQGRFEDSNTQNNSNPQVHSTADNSSKNNGNTIDNSPNNSQENGNTIDNSPNNSQENVTHNPPVITEKPSLNANESPAKQNSEKSQTTTIENAEIRKRVASENTAAIAKTNRDAATTTQPQTEITQRLQKIEAKFDTIEQILQSLKTEECANHHHSDQQANQANPANCDVNGDNPAIDQTANHAIDNDQANNKTPDQIANHNQSNHAPEISPPTDAIRHNQVSNQTQSEPERSQPEAQQVKQNASQNIAAIVHNLVEQSTMPHHKKSPKNHTNQGLSLSDLQYPSQLTAPQCQSLQASLSKLADSDQAQSVLDLFAQRLENTQNPVKNITAYFAKLVRRHQTGKLDLSSVHGEGVETQQDKENAKQRHALQVKYSQYHADYQHFEKVVQREMQTTGSSFTEACETTQMGAVLAGIEHKRDAAKQALAQL